MDESLDIAVGPAPRKRPRSPSVTSAVLGEPISHRQPKRQRRARARDGAVEESATAARNGPLSRRVLKREAKRARRAAGKAARERSSGTGMDVDAEGGGGLEFTFMAGVEGILSV